MKREGLKKTTKKSNVLFDILNDIKIYKTGTLLDDEDSVYYREFNSFMILQFLSMNNENCELVNLLNHYQGNIDKKKLYLLLIKLIPYQRTFDPFITGSLDKNEKEQAVCQYYNCSLKEAKTYIDMFGDEWADDVKSQFGGTIKE